MTQDMHKKI